MIGKMNGEHWYLYLTEPHTLLTPPASPQEGEVETETKILSLPTKVTDIHGFSRPEAEDETLEILMTDLEEENAKQFYLDHASAVAERQYHSFRSSRDEHIDVFSNTSSDTGDIVSDEEEAYPEELTTEGHALGTVVSESCGLSNIYPKSKYPEGRIDAYQFYPCGFSANGVIPAHGVKSRGHYFTVHVTPESHCSYASFETNVPASQNKGETIDIIDHVVDIFKPGRFTVTLFEAKPSIDEKAAADLDALHEIKALERQAARRHFKMDNIKGYRRVDRIVHDLDGYDLVFRYYERNDWKGGAPRIGEKY